MKPQAFICGAALFVAITVLIGNTKQSNKYSTSTSLCHLGGNEARGSFKGITTNVTPAPGGKRIVTITQGSDGCSATAIGTVRQLKQLAIVGSRVSFNGTIKDGLISNISGVKNDYSVVDSTGNIGNLNKASVVIEKRHVRFYNTSKEMIVIVNGKRLLGNTNHVQSIKYGKVNTITYDNNQNLVQIN